MAIVNADKQNVAPVAVVNATAESQTTSAVKGGGKFSWLNPDATSMWSIGRNPQSEIVAAMTEAFAKFAKEARLPLNFDTIVVDNNNYSELQYTAFVLTCQARELPDAPVAYHAYLIEASGNPIPTEVRTVNGQQIELQRLPSDANDAELRRIVSESVTTRFPNSPCFETSAEIIPRSFELKNEERLWFAFINGVLASRAMLDFHYAEADLNLANAQRDSTLTVHVERNTQALQDTNGLPLRSDVVLSTIARSKQGEGVGSLNRQSQALLSRVAGFTDFIWRRQPGNQANAWGQQQQQNQYDPLYQPLFVVTTSNPEDIQSLPAQLLTLATTSVLMEDRRWTFSLMPRKGTGKKKEADLHDIGAVGYDANFENNADGVGAPLKDTNADSFTLGNLNGLLSLVSTPNLLIGMDVPECGSSTWQHAIFSAAADGNQDAISAIVNAADYLTNGHFSKIWQGGRIAYNYGGRIHMGYYLDADRNPVDIRNISYLTVLNMFGKHDMNIVRQWSESFNNESIPLEVRLQHRKNVIDQFNPTYTGFGRRDIFDGHFIQALAQACAVAGLSLKPEVPYNDMTTDVRTPAGFLGSAVITSAATGLFNYSSGVYQGGYHNQAFSGFTGTGNINI